MNWIVVSDKDGTRFYLTKDELASDILERAWRGSVEDALDLCARQNVDPAWGELRWHCLPLKVSA